MEAVAENVDAVISWLVSAGVDLDAVDSQGRTAFDLARAAGRPHILALLARDGSSDDSTYSVVKVMLLGDSLAGKSSLVKALAHAADVGVSGFGPGWREF